jgi:hypothetical protein
MKINIVFISITYTGVSEILSIYLSIRSERQPYPPSLFFFSFFALLGLKWTHHILDYAPEDVLEEPNPSHKDQSVNWKSNLFYYYAIVPIKCLIAYN